ncbi:MAG: PEP-utilizing enzyme [Planctomycetota bacterium]|nr:PEP-utilizing enzyme [Planctomycetota bacterium]
MTEAALNTTSVKHPARESAGPGVLNGLGSWTIVWALALNLFLYGPLLAIPSPDVVIGIFASVGQILGLLAVSAGGILFAHKRRRNHLAGDNAGLKTGIPSWALKTLLALFVVSITANILQYCRTVDQDNERLGRNLLRPSIENGVAKEDSDLRTLSFGQQQAHSLGISTGELAELLKDSKPALIDVRESEEIEMGAIRGSRAIRYPDLRNDPGQLPGKGAPSVLLCYSGNRSSELSEEFKKLGYDCRFLVGGYEKWIAEGHPLLQPNGKRVKTLRGLPGFTNKNRLLDTSTVEELVGSSGAVFVDVRYASDFEKGSLPGAINIPIRKMTTAELENILDTRVPYETPIIIPCYDKRSSFYAQVMGLKLSRGGHEFVGRYTVPHEFFPASSTRPHVLQWQRAQRGDLLGYLSTPFKIALEWLRGFFGHLAIAIILSVLLLRALLLPLALKTEKDQALARKLEPKISGLKKQLADDPDRLLRAINSLRKKNGITPGRNLLATGLQVFLMLLFCNAITSIGSSNNDALGWIPNLSAPDPLLALPIFLGAAVLAHVVLSAGGSRKKRLLTGSALAVLLCAISYNFSAAVNFYLVLSIGTGLLQTLLIAAVLETRESGNQGSSPATSEEDNGTVVKLSDCPYHGGCGNKAVRLGVMIRAGLPVPEGFVLSAKLLESLGQNMELEPSLLRELEAVWKEADIAKAAVRSSGLNEDGSDKSYAGIFDSVLNVEWKKLGAAVKKVKESINGGRVSSYGLGAEERGGIIIQKMVPAEYAGVLFTEHPRETGSMLVEMVEGLGEALVSGAANPSSFRYGRFSGRKLDEHCSPLDLTPLIELGTRIEELFGAPQDIEWACRDGEFSILQARDVTTRLSNEHEGKPQAAFEIERRRLLELAVESGAPEESGTALYQNELSELLPRPTPLSLSLMQSLWEPGGSTDLACRILGIPYEAEEEGAELLVSAFGHLYINRPVEKRRSASGPGLIASFRLTRDAWKLKQNYQEVFLPGYLRELKIREAIDLSRLETSELLEVFRQWREDLRTRTHVQVELINIAADFYMRSAERAIRGKVPVLPEGPRTIVRRALELLPAIKRGERDSADFIELYGHRSTHDYELSSPRYNEDPKLLAGLVEMASSEDHSPVTARDKTQPASAAIASIAADRASQFQSLKEEAKHHCLREFALLRRLLLELDGRLKMDGKIFQLKLEELDGIDVDAPCASCASLRALAAKRLEEGELFSDIVLKTKLTMTDLEKLDSTPVSEQLRTSSADLKGLVVAGDSWALGAARVLNSPSEIESFKEGEILVARFTDPSWAPVFSRAAGLITEVGGRLSHAAILAREINVPAIVGVEGATSSIRTGDLVRMHQDGGIELLANASTDGTGQPRLRASILRQDEILEAMVVNVSRNGAMVATKKDLLPGQDLKVVLADSDTKIRARVIARKAPGQYTIRFEKPLEEKGLDGPLLS